jgi:hypothetical protein
MEKELPLIPVGYIPIGYEYFRDDSAVVQLFT